MPVVVASPFTPPQATMAPPKPCLLYTSDAADERSSVDLGGRRIIKKKNSGSYRWAAVDESNSDKNKCVEQLM